MTRTTVTNEQIREYLSVAGSSTVASMATHFKCSEVQIHLKADQMVDDGLLERTKLPVPVRKADGTVYARKAVKAYRVRVQPPVATPETKLYVDTNDTPHGELRFTFPEPSDLTQMRDAIRELEAFKAEAIARHPDLAPVDYEAYREALALFFRARNSKSDEDHVSGGGILTPYHKEHIRGIIAASQLLSKDRSDDT